jgi:hypothetical protein
VSKALCILVVLMGVACATTSGVFAIKYQCVDVPSERRIEMRYQNEMGHTICLLPEFWPNAAGAIGTAPGTFVLVVGQQRFPIESRNTGYCPGCAERVAPGETIRTSIPYGSFSLPASLTYEEKHIEFVVKAFRCKK